MSQQARDIVGELIEIKPPQPTRNCWAMLVGINRYMDFAHLKFCVNDVLALSKMLTQVGYTVICLHDELDRDDPRFPTRDNIEAELTRLCTAVGKEDLLLVYFACHGTLVENKPVLISQDIRQETLKKRALPLEEVESIMRGSKASRLILLLDACHTGVEIGRTGGKTGPDVLDPIFIRNAYELAEGFALIAASTAQQVAQEWHEKQHGAFTYFLLEGLSGDADLMQKDFVTVNDLQAYVVDRLSRWYIESRLPCQEITWRAEGLGDMILADYRKRSHLKSKKQLIPTVPRIRDFPPIKEEPKLDLANLHEALKAGNWRKADRETYLIMLQAVKRESRFRQEDVEKLSCNLLFLVDQIWLDYSDGNFGFIIQQKIWIHLGGQLGKSDSGVFRRFGDHVGWRKNGDWREYNDFSFSLDAEQGHLPSFGYGENSWNFWGTSFQYFLSHFGTCLQA